MGNGPQQEGAEVGAYQGYSIIHSSEGGCSEGDLQKEEKRQILEMGTTELIVVLDGGEHKEESKH